MTDSVVAAKQRGEPAVICDEWCGEEDSNFHGVAPTSPSS